MRCRHRVSKLLLLHGRVYDGRAPGRRRTVRWLEQQRFDEPATELAYLDTLAAVDGLVARKAALDERLSRLAFEGEWWPTVARLRCFRGIDTLTAFVLCLEIGDFGRFQRPAQLASWLGLVPSLDQSGESRRQGAITKTGSSYARRLLVEAAWHYLRQPRHRRRDRRTPRRPARPRPPDRPARPAPPAPPRPPPPRARQARQRHHRRRRPRTRLLPLGRRRGRLTPHHSRLFGWAPGRHAARHARLIYGQPQHGHARS